MFCTSERRGLFHPLWVFCGGLKLSALSGPAASLQSVLRPMRKRRGNHDIITNMFMDTTTKSQFIRDLL